ncbi:17-beta-hydroxysteroid dehydrogenase type 2-like [Oppia nitens]|uniref:17-beta-hydroxysteroid dehydrogenase type 2-like n=1 Tax=Oppia nitens TaxID=1686743 RepID=UPI0023DCB4A5|nr:17-beta-hydroxysteroid dehydrogenase type 2-like [Oppia nitens]
MDINGDNQLLNSPKAHTLSPMHPIFEFNANDRTNGKSFNQAINSYHINEGRHQWNRIRKGRPSSQHVFNGFPYEPHFNAMPSQQPILRYANSPPVMSPKGKSNWSNTSKPVYESRQWHHQRGWHYVDHIDDEPPTHRTKCCTDWSELINHLNACTDAIRNDLKGIKQSIDNSNDKLIDTIKECNSQLNKTFIDIIKHSDIINTIAEFLSKVILFAIWIYLSWNLSQSLWRLKFIPKRCVNPKGKAVLITGCDTGFGNKLAQRLAYEGYHVFAGCLIPNSSGAQHLKKQFEDNITIVSLDVTKDESVLVAKNLIQKSLNTKELWAIVNNAGVLSSYEVEFGDMSSFVCQMDVNCLGTVRVTKAFVPLLRHCRGRVINMASLAGRFAIPGMVGYCMSKSGVISFSDGLRREMKKWGIDVICIEPHLFRTNLVNGVNHNNALVKAWQQTPQEIREAYGESYFQGYQALLNKALETARPGVDSVVNTMFNAVTHHSVSANYRVLGHFERLRVWMFEYLWPIRALDYISYIGCIWATGLPQLIKISISKYSMK